jgi:RsmE family RNA methyltransferase
MNIILLLPEDQTDESCYCLHDSRAEHIRSVLRGAEGDVVEIGLLNGPQGIAEILSIGPKFVELQIRELRKQQEVMPIVDLICALPRPQTLKRVLAACGTMAVRQLHLVRANRVERSFYQSPLLQPANMRRHLVEGMMQGRQTRLPRVSVHQRFRPFFEDILPPLVGETDSEALMVVADGGAQRTIAGCCQGRPAWIIGAVGPEGGWVPFELETMRASGFQAVSLGRWVLRVEAAVVALLSQIEMQVVAHRQLR